MTRCCTKTVYYDSIRNTKNIIFKIGLYFQMFSMLTKIYIYEKYLAIRETFGLL